MLSVPCCTRSLTSALFSSYLSIFSLLFFCILNYSVKSENNIKRFQTSTPPALCVQCNYSDESFNCEENFDVTKQIDSRGHFYFGFSKMWLLNKAWFLNNMCVCFFFHVLIVWKPPKLYTFEFDLRLIFFSFFLIKLIVTDRHM